MPLLKPLLLGKGKAFSLVIVSDEDALVLRLCLKIASL